MRRLITQRRARLDLFDTLKPREHLTDVRSAVNTASPAETASRPLQLRFHFVYPQTRDNEDEAWDELYERLEKIGCAYTI